MTTQTLENVIDSLPKQIGNEILVIIFNKNKSFIGYSYMNNINTDLSMSQNQGEPFSDFINRFAKYLRKKGVM